MLSLKKLKGISVAITDNKLPVVVHDFIELSDEDSYEVLPDNEPQVKERSEAGVEMMVRMFKAHIANVKEAIRDKYKAAWCDDMEWLMSDNGITKEDFLKCLNQ